MLTNMFKCLVFLFLFILPSYGFWWRTPSTEPPPPAVKQIPLTYFRTYTYQQPIGGAALPFPLMSSTDYITNYGALGNTPYYNPMMPMMTGGLPNGNEIPMAQRPSKSYAGVNVVRSLNGIVKPAPTTAATTTAKTTTPEPTTSTTTTTTTTTTTPAPTTTSENPTTIEDTPASSPLIQADSLLNIETAYPAFNRKVYTNHFNINYNRPVYPYPEYSIYKPNSPNNPQTNEENKGLNSQSGQPNVEFVPCMCPVNIQGGGGSAYQPGFQGGFQAGIPIAGNPSNSIFLAQGRTNADMEASMDLPMALPVDAVSEASLVDSLQIVKLDEDDDMATESSLT